MDSIKCKKCGKITTGEDLSKIEVSETIKQTLKLCLGNIFESIENQKVSN